MCVKKPLKMANDRRNGHSITAKLLYNYAIFRENSQRETKEFCHLFIYLFILAKVAAKWQLLTLLFRKSKGDNKSQICDFSRYFGRKGKNLVANATVLVAISSPVLRGNVLKGICWVPTAAMVMVQCC